MTVTIRFHSLILALLALMPGCATSPSGMNFASPAGEWNETYETPYGTTRSGRFTIIDETRGSYPGGEVVFFATDDPRNWKGYWIREGGANACNVNRNGSPNWGVVTYRFNENFNRYSGTWDQCGEGRNWSISGLR